MAAGARPAGPAADPDPGGRGRAGRRLPVPVVGLPLARRRPRGRRADRRPGRGSRATSPASCARSAASTRPDGPGPGEHNFYRGGPLATYDEETRDAIARARRRDPARRGRARLGGRDARRPGTASRSGSTATSRSGNLLVRDGRLGAVLDFGSLRRRRPGLRRRDRVDVPLRRGPRPRSAPTLGADAGTWSRGRGWALWKALITLVGYLERGSPRAALPRRDIREVLADYDKDR